MGFHVLKQSFLAALPVFAPHDKIERQLLMAGAKPVGWFFILPHDDNGTAAQKNKEDIKILDQAVAQGRLKSMDIQPENFCPIRLYCQPGKEDDMKKVAEVELGLRWGGNHFNNYAQLMGYRKRDTLYLGASNFLPEFSKKYLFEFNKHTSSAYKAKLLAECATRQSQWSEDYQPD